MDIMNAIKVANLIKRRDNILTMHEQAVKRENQGWSIMFNDSKFPIHTDDKRFFIEALNKALDQIESEIEKL